MTSTADRLSAALADRYRIERELGQGGMATVYLAEVLMAKRDQLVDALERLLAQHTATATLFTISWRVV